MLFVIKSLTFESDDITKTVEVNVYGQHTSLDKKDVENLAIFLNTRLVRWNKDKEN